MMDSRFLLNDPLTGVYSRASLQQRLHEETNRAGRYNEIFSLLFIDLDHFKSVNDAFGHKRGDEVLVAFAARVQAEVRTADVLFRYGGDEFILLLPQTTKMQALPLAMRLLDAIRSQPYQLTPPLTLSASMGLASFPEDGQTPETLFERADQRNYEAKRRGRGRVISEDPVEENAIPFDYISRLVERDIPLQTLHRFLEKLPENGHGALIVNGPDGVGMSRFLSESGRVALLQGYEVVNLRGGAAWKGRAYAVLAESFRDWNMNSLALSDESFKKSLFRWIAQRDRCGLFLVADNFSEIDWATRDWIFRLLFSTSPIPVGLAASANSLQDGILMPFDSFPYHEIIELQPLTEDGLQIWLRTLLRWEPPNEFLHWLFAGSKGFPARVKQALITMVKQELLQKAGEGWHLDAHYAQLDIPALSAPGKTPPASLPIPATTFIGRDHEIQLVKDALTRSRLVTLNGPGGVGKTRLAIQSASEIANSFPHGAHFVPLSFIDTPELIATAIAETLKLGLYGMAHPEVQVVNYLREKQMLLVMDNFEQIVAGAEFLDEILSNAPGVRLLVTSRETLNLFGETAITLEGMEFPRGGATLPVELYSAAQLFIHFARQIHPRFSMTDEDRQYIARICQMVEGIPLGIELAAAWVRTLDCREIAEEMSHSLDFLTSNLRNLPDRHRSLRAVFESSWRLLNEDERQVFERISLFHSGFMRDAAVTIANASLATLSALVFKSLLYRDEAGRYNVHEVLLHYAGEKLAEKQDITQKTIAAYRKYYIDFLRQRETRLETAGQQRALEEIQRDIDNIRSAWQYVLDGQYWELVDQAITPLCHYYIIRGLHHEGEEVFTLTVEAMKQSESGGNTADKLLIARANSRLASFLLRKADFSAARQLLEGSLPIFDECAASKEIARTYRYLAWLEENLGNYAAAEACCKQSLKYARAANDRRCTALVLNQLGVVFYTTGQYDKAYQTHLQSLALFRESGDRWGIGRALTNIGNVQSQMGDFDAARQSYRECLIIDQELGDRSGESVLTNNLGDVERELGNLSDAVVLLEQSVEICKEIGDREGLALSIGNLADIARKQGQLEKARRLLSQSLEIYLAIGSRPGVGYITNHLASLEIIEGHYDKARQHLRKTFRIVLDNHAQTLGADAALTLAHLLTEEGKAPDALVIALHVRQNPVTLLETRNLAGNLIASLTLLIEPDKRAAAEAASANLTIETIARQLVTSE